VADVPEVAILAVDLLLADGDRHVVLLGVFDGALAVPQFEARILPGRDDLQFGVQGHVGQLEAHLVVSLASCAVSDRIRPGLVRHFDLLGGDERPGDAGAQQVVLLVDRVRPQHREAIFLGELLAQVHDDHFIRAAFVCLLLDPLELISLPQLSGERDQLHARVTLLQPGEDDGRIQAAAVGEDDFLRGLLLLLHRCLQCKRRRDYRNPDPVEQRSRD
jgi:hypothetical protein